MDYEHLANGLWVPSLPTRDWDTHYLLHSNETYTSEDAAQVQTYLWETYADGVERVLFDLLQICCEIEIGHEKDRRRLIHRFVQYPTRPQIQIEVCAEPDRVLNHQWNQWACQIERLFMDLRNTIEKRVRTTAVEQEPNPLDGNSNLGTLGQRIAGYVDVAELWIDFLMRSWSKHSKPFQDDKSGPGSGLHDVDSKDPLARMKQRGIEDDDGSSSTQLEDSMADLKLDQNSFAVDWMHE